MLLEFVVWIISAFIVYRLAELVVTDDGPFAVFEKIRMWTGMYDYNAAGEQYPNSNQLQKFIGGILSCIYCAGIWIAFFVTLVWWWYFKLYFIEAVAVWLATAGAQSVLESAVGRSHDK